MASLYGISIKLTADLKDFSSKLQNAERNLKRFGKNMQRIGKNLSIGITAPLTAFAAISVKAFDVQAQAINKLSTQIALNGKEVSGTLDDYRKFASELQTVTTVGDETTLQLLQLAESMQSSAPKEAVTGAIALSKALGMDLKAAVKASTLAIEGDYTMLNRYVPSLKTASSEAEKAAIVQKLFADGLEIAKTEAEIGLGPIKQLRNSWGDFMEKIGDIVSQAITPLVQKLTDVVEWLNNLDDRTRRIIVLIGGIAAAIGPLLITIGILANGVAALSAGFAVLTSPITLIIAAIAALVAAGLYLYDNWDAVRQNMAAIMIKLKNGFIEGIKGMILTLTYFHRKIAEVFGLDFVKEGVDKLMGWLDGFKSQVPEVTTEFKSFGDTVSSLTDKMIGVIPSTEKTNDQLKAIELQAKATGEAIDRSIPKAIAPKIGKVEGGESQAIDINTKPLSKATKILNEYASAIKNAVVNNRIMGSELGSIDEQINITQASIANLTAQGYDEQNIAIQGLIAKLNELLLKKQKIQAANEAEIKQEQTRNRLINLTQSAATQLGNSLVDAAFSGANAMQSLKNALIQVSKQIITAFLAQAISSAIAKAMSSTGNPVLGLILAGVAVAGVAAMFASKVPKLAKGGMAFSPTYAMIGDNPNAVSDPEVISPLSKLKQYLNTGDNFNGNVSFVIEGDQLVGVLNRYNSKIGRIR